MEAHLDITIPQVDATMAVPVDEYDGKVAYGEKRGKSQGERIKKIYSSMLNSALPSAVSFENHTALLAPSVRDLEELETSVQVRKHSHLSDHT